MAKQDYAKLSWDFVLYIDYNYLSIILLIFLFLNCLFSLLHESNL